MGVGRGPKNFGTLGPAPFDGRMADSLEIWFSATCVIEPNLVVVRQITRAQLRYKNLIPRVPPFNVTQGH